MRIRTSDSTRWNAAPSPSDSLKSHESRALTPAEGRKMKMPTKTSSASAMEAPIAAPPVSSCSSSSSDSRAETFRAFMPMASESPSA